MLKGLAEANGGEIEALGNNLYVHGSETDSLRLACLSDRYAFEDWEIVSEMKNQQMKNASNQIMTNPEIFFINKETGETAQLSGVASVSFCRKKIRLQLISAILIILNVI